MKLMQMWGFESEKRQGGHLVMILKDRRVQISAPTRRMPTPMKALRRAANIVGVDLRTFLLGPIKEHAGQTQTDIRVEQPCGCVVHEGGLEPCSQHTKEEEVVVKVQEDEVTKATRRRIRQKGGKPIAEVRGWRSNRGRAAVRSFDIESEELDIELLDEEDEGTQVAPEVPVQTLKTSRVKVQAPVQTPEVSMSRTQMAQEIMDSLFTNDLPDTEEAECASNLWIAATVNLLRVLEVKTAE